MDGVRVVVVCRLGRIRSNRDSRSVLLRVEIDGSVGVVEGRMICTRLCARVSSGDRVDGVCLEIDGLVCRVEGRVICVGVCVRVCVWVWVSTRDGIRGVKTRVRFSELLLDCGPIRVPILWERERLDDGVRETLGDRVVLGVVACGDLEKLVGVRRWIVGRLGVGARCTDGARVDMRGAVGIDRLWVTMRLGVGRETEGAERRMLGAALRVGMVRWRALPIVEREGARLGAGAVGLACALLCARAWVRLPLRREV